MIPGFCEICSKPFVRLRRRGSFSECTPCQSNRRVRAWKRANPERAKASSSQPTAAQKKAYAQSAKGVLSGRRKSTAYAKHARHARVSWVDQPLVDDLYALAAIYREAGIEAQVDHVIPLRGRLVCGLHVENNLTVIPALANRVKKNRFLIF